MYRLNCRTCSISPTVVRGQTRPSIRATPSWSSNVVGGQTFDGTSAHKFEWVSVLNPGDEQDDEVGLAGTAVGPELSGADLPFTHPFGPDFEFTIVPDPEYDGLLAPANKDPLGVYGGNWTVAEPAGISVPVGVLGLEVDAALVPPDYRPTQGNRVAVYRSLDRRRGSPRVPHGDSPAAAHGACPVQSTGMEIRRNAVKARRPCSNCGVGPTRLASCSARMATPGSRCVTTLKTSRSQFMKSVFRPSSPSRFRAFTSYLSYPAANPPGANQVAPLLHLQCSYHFTVNGSCSVEVIPSPADPNSVLVTVRLDSARYPALPEPPSQFDTFSINALLAQVPGGDISKAYKMLLDALAVFQDVHVRRFAAPQIPQGTQGSANIVPFTALNVLPRSSQTTDNNQPFPVYGWVKLQWVSAAIFTNPVHLKTGIQVHGPAV